MSPNVLISIGQLTHQSKTRLEIWSSGFKVKSIPRLDNDDAMKQGAEFMGEFFIFSVAGILVVWEYDKSKKKEKVKEEELNMKIGKIGGDVENRIKTLEGKILKLEETIVNMNNNQQDVNSNRISDIEQKLKRRSWLW